VTDTIHRPALLVSAPASGQGKTLLTAALARAWRNQGLSVRAFKCGPDFLDPMVLETATGHPVENLDLAMCGEADGRARLCRAARQADVIVVEGVMGLFDGVPSSADVARIFDLPVALVIDASAMAQTFGRLAAGLCGGLPCAGVIANGVGSDGHATLLRDSLPPAIPWLGALPKKDAFALPERHLGLFRAAEINDLEQRIEAAAQALSACGPLPLPRAVTFPGSSVADCPPALAGKTIAVARDEAFCFLYPANLECLQMMGARLLFFSPLHDRALPEADAYWFPGGYPELHAQHIAANRAMREALHAAWRAGRPMLAECGGMMALCEAIGDHAGFGVLPGKAVMEPRLQGLGVQFADFDAGRLHAHTFHYSRLETPLAPALTASAQGNRPGEAIYRHGPLTASYLHFYFPSNPVAVAAIFGARP
jgi:cobyrinic acid a,c-diamide synthase